MLTTWAIVAAEESCARPVLKPTPKYRPSRTVPKMPQRAIRIREICADMIYLLSLTFVSSMSGELPEDLEGENQQFKLSKYHIHHQRGCIRASFSAK
jgi:hypothetical protein